MRGKLPEKSPDFRGLFFAVKFGAADHENHLSIGTRFGRFPNRIRLKSEAATARFSCAPK